MKYFFTFLCLLTMICSTRAQTLHIIESGNFFYEPTDLTIQIGDTVRWINVSGFHNVNAEVNTITGENFNNPESFFSNPTSNEVLLTRVFTVAGRYEYDCSVGSHAASGMVGSLTVEGTNTTAEVETALTNELGVVYHSDTKTFALNFYLNTSSETALVNIANLAGQQLQSTPIRPISGANVHQVSSNVDMPRGIYLVSLHVDGTTSTQKVFVY